ncbi:MAG TPA: hypothetical protein VNK46_11145 [Nitrospiraceae bacterium]|nr:hypothetical protein [Nitrospiraceae bacterium]
MNRIMADPSVSVSAIVIGRTGEEIPALARAGLEEIFVSPPIPRELCRAVMDGVHRAQTIRVREAMAEIATLTSLVRPTVKLSNILKDDEHRPLACAVSTDASFLMTRDHKHPLPIKTLQEVLLVSPCELPNVFH